MNFNHVYTIDAIEGLKQLEDNSVDLIFTDPPYNININYGQGLYKDNLSEDKYLDWCHEWQTLCLSKLKDTGSLYLMHYPDVCAFWMVDLKEKACFRKWISWVYSSNIGHSKSNFTTAHRTILYFTKTDKYIFNALADPQPYKNPNDKRVKKLIENGRKGVTPYDWWDFQLVKNVSKQKTMWENQIPVNLVERVVKMSTNKGDLVVDPFMGSGTTAEAAYLNGRNYIGFDINPESVSQTKKRVGISMAEHV